MIKGKIFLEIDGKEYQFKTEEGLDINIAQGYYEVKISKGVTYKTNSKLMGYGTKFEINIDKNLVIDYVCDKDNTLAIIL